MKQPRMKTLIITLLIALAFASCKDDDFKLNDTIRLTGVQSSPVRSAEMTDSLAFITRYAWHCSVFSQEDNARRTRTFGLLEEWTAHRDTVNNRLLLIGIDVIYGDKLGGFVVDYSDILLIAFIAPDGKYIHPRAAGDYGPVVFEFPTDTVGYIPNRVVLDARTKITAAFNDGDLAEVQRLFDEAFIFKPTTGAKWLALKAAGIE